MSVKLKITQSKNYFDFFTFWVYLHIYGEKSQYRTLRAKHHVSKKD